VQQGFGPREEILRKLVMRAGASQAATGNLKVVGDTAVGGQK
jgi:hypothetical protein